jgi:L-ascorbate metabolism protein UlaG (beta-lactamase superfamily)
VAGDELIRAIASQQIPLDAVGVWFLNQFGYVFKGANGVTVYVDPYLSDALEEATRGRTDEHVRTFLPPIQGWQVTNADYVFTTHNHLDHLDPKAVQEIATASPGAKFVAPPVCKSVLLDLGISEDRILPLGAGKTLDLERLCATATPGAHETFDVDPEHGHVYVGFVLEFPGVTVWHSGDTVVFDGLVDLVRSYHPDLVFLPINGRNYFKLRSNIRGNMNYVEAADVAAELGADIVFPSHWGQHECNTENPGTFVDYLAQRHRYQRFRILAPGEGIVYTRGTTFELGGH